MVTRRHERPVEPVRRRLAGVPAGQPRQRARPPRGRRLRRGRAGRRVRHARLHLRRGRHPRARPRLPATPSRARTDDFEVLYASKALPRHRRLPALREEGLSVDVASGGELHMALPAGFDPARIHMHGNNKTEAELRYAVDAGVGHLILDSFDEIELRRAAARPPAGRADPGDARDQADHPLLRADRPARLEVRLRARGRPRRAGGRAGARLAEPRAGRAARPHRLADLRARALRQGDRGARRARRAVDWSRSCSTSAAASGIAYTAADEPPSIEDYVEVKVRGVAARLRPGAADPGRARPLAGRATPASPRTGSAR